jgi:hypothetical protein
MTILLHDHFNGDANATLVAAGATNGVADRTAAVVGKWNIGASAGEIKILNNALYVRPHAATLYMYPGRAGSSTWTTIPVQAGVFLYGSLSMPAAALSLSLRIQDQAGNNVYVCSVNGPLVGDDARLILKQDTSPTDSLGEQLGQSHGHQSTITSNLTSVQVEFLIRVAAVDGQNVTFELWGKSSVTPSALANGPDWFMVSRATVSTAATSFRPRIDFNTSGTLDATFTSNFRLHRIMIGTADEVSPFTSKWRRAIDGPTPVAGAIVETATKGTIVVSNNSAAEDTVTGIIVAARSSDSSRSTWTSLTALNTLFALTATRCWDGVVATAHGDQVVVIGNGHTLNAGVRTLASGLYAAISNDGGDTWSELVTVAEFAASPDTITQGKLVRLSNGRWLFECHRRTGATVYFIHTMNPAGEWTTDTHTTGQFPYYEVSPVEMPDGRVYVLGRSGTGFKGAFFSSNDSFAATNLGTVWDLAAQLPGTSQTSDVIYDPGTARLIAFLRGDFGTTPERKEITVHASTDGLNWSVTRGPLLSGGNWQSARFMKINHDLIGAVTNRRATMYLREPNWFARDYQRIGTARRYSY